MDVTVPANIVLFINAVLWGVLGVAAFAAVMWAIETLWRRMPSAPTNVRGRMAAWLDTHAAPEWRIAHRLRSIQLAILWAVVGGLWAALPAFESYVTPIRFAALCVGFSLAICFARLTGQKGLPNA